MNTLDVFVRPEAKLGNPHGHIGSTCIKATKQHPQKPRTCRRHGTRPGFWHLASAHGCPNCMACALQSDISSTSSTISSIANACRKDWHSRCTFLCRGNACNAAGTSHLCLRWSLCWQLLLVSTRQLVPRMLQQRLVSRGRFNRSVITQHRRVTQWKQLDC